MLGAQRPHLKQKHLEGSVRCAVEKGRKGRGRWCPGCVVRHVPVEARARCCVSRVQRAQEGSERLNVQGTPREYLCKIQKWVRKDSF